MSSEKAQSPARTVLSIPELRQRIFRSLDGGDLAVCMRIGRESMVDVSAELYRSMSYDEVQYKMCHASAREKMYCNSVIEIDARSLTLSPTVISQLQKAINQYGGGSLDQSYRIGEYLKHYHPELPELIIPPLRRKCPRLRKIYFGPTRPTKESASWVVHCGGTGEEALGKRGKKRIEEGKQGGHIDYIVSYDMRVALVPPDITSKGAYMTCPLPPKPRWTIRQSFDLCLKPSDSIVDKELEGKWALAFKEGPCFDHLNQVIDFSNLPLDIGTIIDIYNRQISSGSRPRLSSISALHVNPYTLSDFSSLAQIASTSLTSLDLHNCWRQRYSEERTSLSFTDLPDLARIIRKHLPNLHKLWIALKGIETAERLCRGMLHSTTLEEVGTISDLRITTAKYKGVLFDTIRSLSNLTSPDAKAWICCQNAKGWEPETLTLFLQCLRRQPTRVKYHLSTVRFQDLGIARPEQIKELRHDLDGRPIPLSIKEN